MHRRLRRIVARLSTPRMWTKVGKRRNKKEEEKNTEESTKREWEWKNEQWNWIRFQLHFNRRIFRMTRKQIKWVVYFVFETIDDNRRRFSIAFMLGHEHEYQISDIWWDFVLYYFPLFFHLIFRLLLPLLLVAKQIYVISIIVFFRKINWDENPNNKTISIDLIRNQRRSTMDYRYYH